MKWKRYFLAVLLVILTFTIAHAKPIRSKNVYHDRQTFKKEVRLDQKVRFGTNAQVLSTSRIWHAPNEIHNSMLGVWSAASQYGVNTGAAPDGWYNQDPTNTGLTLYNLADIDPGLSGSTIMAGFTHAMYVVNTAATTGAGVTDYVGYPNSGTSDQLAWYGKFLGKRTVCGMWIFRDNGQTTASGITTNLVRPYINTGSGTTEESIQYGTWAGKSGWQLVSAVTDVPPNATAFECGFAIQPTALAALTSGDTFYVTAPFIQIDPLQEGYVFNPGEVVFLDQTIDVFTTGGSTFGIGGLVDGSGNTLDLSQFDGFGGRIPDDITMIYATVKAEFASTQITESVQFYGDNSANSGITLFSTQANDISTVERLWIPISNDGLIKHIANAVATGVSIEVHAVKMR